MAAFDVVGLGALNYDHIVVGGGDLEDTETVMPKAQIFAELDSADGVRQEPRCGGSAFTTILMLRQAIDLRAGFIGVTPLTPPEGFPSHVAKLEDCHVEFIGSREPGEPGVCGSIAAAKGRRLFVDPQDNVKIGAVLSQETLAAIHGAKLLHVSSLLEPIGSQEFRVARAVADFVHAFKEVNPEAVVTVDPGDPWTRPGSRSDEVNRVLALADMLFLNDGEYHQLTGGSSENRLSAQVLRDVAPRAAVHVLKELTGLRLLHPSGLTSFALGRADGDKAIDPTGAGDAVAAGILGSVVEGRTLVEGSDLALRLAALRVSGVGDDGHRNLRKKLGELWRDPAPPGQPAEEPDSAHRPIVVGFLGLIVLCLGLVGGLATPLGDYAYPSGLLLAAVVYVGDLILFRRGKLVRERLWVGVAVLLAIGSAVWLGVLLGKDDPPVTREFTYLVKTQEVVTPIKVAPDENAAESGFLRNGDTVYVRCLITLDVHSWFQLSQPLGWLRDDQLVPAMYTGEGEPPQCPDY